MLRRRRSLSPRMRELAVIYSTGGLDPVSVAIRRMRERDTWFLDVVQADRASRRAGWFTTPPPAA